MKNVSVYVSDKKIGPSEKYTMIALSVSNYNNEEKFLVLQNTIKNMVNLNVSNVKRHLKNLKEQGYLKSKKNKDAPNTYELTFPKISTMEEFLDRYNIFYFQISDDDLQNMNLDLDLLNEVTNLNKKIKKFRNKYGSNPPWEYLEIKGITEENILHHLMDAKE